VTHVFISHSHLNDDFVNRLAADLRAAGVQTWVDHENILPSQDWDDAVAAALEACEAMILVLTPRAVDSKNVKVEWSYFFDLDKPIYPVILEPCKVPFRLRLNQQVDFTGSNEKGLSDLCRALGVSLNSPDIPTAEMVAISSETLPSLPRLNGMSHRPSRQPFEPEMVLVPAGPFRMGSSKTRDPRAFDTELPQHTVMLPTYWIGRYPVTVGEYRAFIEAGGYHKEHYWTQAGWAWRSKDSRTQPEHWGEEQWTGDDWLPIIGVSWYEAYAYCRWLSETTGHAYRLPTEEEWEKAARGTDGRLYPWGNEWREGVCNTAEASMGHVTPVGQYSPLGDSPYGVADMSGNVWEWCLTMWRGSYRQPANDDPEGDARRVVRGGIWHNLEVSARAAFRYWFSPFVRYHSLGFRVACTTEAAWVADL